MFVQRLRLRAPDLLTTWIERPNLELRLTPGIRVMSIVAGPGYGKTVVAARLFHGAPEPKAWYSFDSSDIDSAVFTTHCNAALDDLRAARIAAMEISELKAAREIGSYLAERIASLPQPPIFVFDDVHELEGSLSAEALRELIVRGVRVGATFIVCGRSMPIALHTIAARAQLASVAASDLRFDRTETTDALAIATNADSVDERLLAAAAHADGWAAGIALIASTSSVSHRTAVDFAHFPSGQTKRLLFDYLASEVFDRIGAAERRLLLETAILDRLETASCDAILGWKDSAAMLESLAERGLFVSRLSTDAYIWHRLFRDFLRHELRARSSPAEIAKLHGRAADAYAQRGDVARTVAHRIDAGALDQAVLELAASAFELLRAGAVSTVGALLGRLPRESIARNAVLSTALGSVHFQAGDNERAASAFERAIRLAARDGLHDVRAVAVRAFAPILGSRGAFSQLRTLLEETLSLSPLEESRATALRMSLGALCVETGRFDEALQIFSAIMPLVVARGDIGVQASILHNTAVAHLRRGDIYEGVSLYERAFTLKERAGQRASALVTQADLVFARMMLGDFDEAGRIVDELLLAAADYGSAHTFARAHELRGTLHLEQNDIAAAELAFAHALRICDPADVLVRPYIMHGLARCALERRAYARADEDCARASDMLRNAGLGQQASPILVTRARCALALGDTAAAVRYACDALTMAREGADFALRAAAYFEAAALLLQCVERCDREDSVVAERAATTAVTEAFALVHQRDYRFLLRTKAVALATLEPLLRRCGIDPAVGPRAPSNAPPLAISFFGAFRVEVDGRPITGEWKRRKARDLFAYIVSRNGRAVPRAKMLDLFWPDIDADAANDVLRVTISAIRKAVGKVVRYEASAYRFEPPRGTVVDVVLFDEAIERGRAAITRGASADAARAFVAATERYAGDFLEDVEDVGWEWRERERLRAAALEALRWLATASGVAVATRRLARERLIAIAPFDLQAIALRLTSLAEESGDAAADVAYAAWRSHYRVTVGSEPPNVWPLSAMPALEVRASGAA